MSNDDDDDDDEDEVEEKNDDVDDDDAADDNDHGNDGDDGDQDEDDRAEDCGWRRRCDHDGNDDDDGDHYHRRHPALDCLKFQPWAWTADDSAIRVMDKGRERGLELSGNTTKP